MDRDSQQYDQHTTLPQPVVNDAANTIPTPTPPLPPQNATAPVASSNPLPSQQQPAAPPVAQDADTIEPMWVDRVNQLMQQTINDPHLLAQEFQKLKGQYIAGRYGKDLKQQDGKG